MADNRWLEDIMNESEKALPKLQETELTQYVDTSLPLPKPYLGSGKIRLVIIGQDPTVQRKPSRPHVRTVLNLNTKRGLWAYLDKLCQDSGISLEENVYATNACKNFFTEPPTKLKSETGVDVLAASAPIWLPVLHQELAAFPEARVISLGEPVLTMLVHEGYPREVKHYWGYHRQWKEGRRNPMRPVTAEQSTIGRAFHPFIHQPTYRSPRAAFYRKTWDAHMDFVREQSNLQAPMIGNQRN